MPLIWPVNLTPLIDPVNLPVLRERRNRRAGYGHVRKDRKESLKPETYELTLKI
jgi:hypothetical protein